MGFLSDSGVRRVAGQIGLLQVKDSGDRVTESKGSASHGKIASRKTWHPCIRPAEKKKNEMLAHRKQNRLE